MPLSDKISSIIEKHHVAFVIISFGLLGVVWGSTFITIKKALVVFTPFQITTVRFVTTAIFYIPFAIKHWQAPTRHEWPWLLASGLLGIFMPNMLISIAGQHIDSATSGILNSLVPIFTLLIGLVVFGQKVILLRIIGVVIGFAGSAFLVLLNSDSGGGLFSFNSFALLVVLATLFYGINVNIIKFKLRNLRPTQIPTLGVVALSPLAIALAGFSGFEQNLAPTQDVYVAIACILFLGFIASAAAQLLFNKLIKATTTALASSVTYLMPLVALLWGWLDGEIIRWAHIPGIAAILLGVFLVGKKQKNSKQVASN